MTERNDEIAAFQILWPYSGWQAFELEFWDLYSLAFELRDLL